MKKKKKKKINRRKMYSRIIFLFVLIFIVITLIKNITKKEDAKFDVAVIINNENVTNKLEDEPYINNDNVLYLSTNDIGKIFDSDIYFEKESNKFITTSETKVAAIDVANNIMEINSASRILSPTVLDYGKDKYYLPLSALTNIYNIEVLEREHSAIISSLYDEMIIAKTLKKVSVKEGTSIFSHTIQKLDKDEEMIFVQDAEKKDWAKVLTYDRKHWVCEK